MKKLLLGLALVAGGLHAIQGAKTPNPKNTWSSMSSTSTTMNDDSMGGGMVPNAGTNKLVPNYLDAHSSNSTTTKKINALVKKHTHLSVKKAEAGLEKILIHMIKAIRELVQAKVAQELHEVAIKNDSNTTDDATTPHHSTDHRSFLPEHQMTKQQLEALKQLEAQPKKRF